MLLLLVQQVLLLRLLQGPLVHLRPVQLLQLLALLQGEQGAQVGGSHPQGMPAGADLPQSLMGRKSRKRTVSLLSTHPRTQVFVC